jgi:hypothetical protein
MIFKDRETLTSLYEGITIRIEPSKEQLVRQAPILNKTELSNDQNLLEEAYKSVSKCRSNKKPIDEAKKQNKPDYLDVDEDGDKKEPLKKALKDKSKKPMAENISFKKLFDAIMVEGKHEPDLSTKAPISGPLMRDQKVLMLRRLSNGEISSINDEEQYIVSWKDPQKHNNQQEQPLKGESVHSFLSDITSIRRAFQEQ